MDIYTTSFTYPRVSSISHPHGGSSLTTSANPYGGAQNALNAADPRGPTDLAADADAVHKTAMTATQAHGCLVSFTKASNGKGWNFHLSGAYQQVMAARGMVLRECPTQVCPESRPRSGGCPVPSLNMICSAAPGVHQAYALRDTRSSLVKSAGQARGPRAPR